MKEFYNIENDYAIIELQSSLYPVITIQKSITNFLDTAYIKLEEIDNKIILKIKLINMNNDLEKIIGEFYNELLRESLRYNISKETKNIRELIVGRALYTTCIETDNLPPEESKEKEEYESKYDENEDYSLEEIAVNWFEMNEEKND